jgi:hypothetical protein
MSSVKRLVARHCEERRGARARDGRAWKNRRAGKLDNMIVQFVRTKKGEANSGRCCEDTG